MVVFVILIIILIVLTSGRAQLVAREGRKRVEELLRS